LRIILGINVARMGEAGKKKKKRMLNKLFAELGALIGHEIRPGFRARSLKVRRKVKTAQSSPNAFKLPSRSIPGGRALGDRGTEALSSRDAGSPVHGRPLPSFPGRLPERRAVARKRPPTRLRGSAPGQQGGHRLSPLAPRARQ
jgi:hypothetical protein